MFARITPYKMKSDSIDAATEMMHSLKDQIMSLDGVHQFMNVMQSDGSGYVISVVESEEASDKNADQVRALWANFGPYLEAIPTPEGYDVLVDWKI